ncbi:MAG: hypothetical protein ACK4NC_00225 [Candidatus Gracilibacteria bacterium]
MYSDTSSCIFHVDADSFFASVARARDPSLSDKPVCVVAGERGCVLAATYEAKKLGIHTAMPYHQAIKILPLYKAYYVPAHFRDYAQYSDMMFRILREYSPQVEETSIDEGYMDMTGCEKMHGKNYSQIAQMIQRRIKRDLGLPVSFGIASTRILAKIASKKSKPFGVLNIYQQNIREFLAGTTYEDVPGIGRKSQALLTRNGFHTPLEFSLTYESMSRSLLGQPGTVLWNELNGRLRTPVALSHSIPKSLSRIRSFKLTKDVSFLRSEFIHHVLLCTYKLRKKGLVAKRFLFYFRDANYERPGKEYSEEMPHNSAFKFLSRSLPDFLRIAGSVNARSVGVVFVDLIQDKGRQPSLFAEDNLIFRQEDFLKAADKINEKFGKYTVIPASLDAKIFSREPWTVELLSVPYLGEVK